MDLGKARDAQLSEREPAVAPFQSSEVARHAVSRDASVSQTWHEIRKRDGHFVKICTRTQFFSGSAGSGFCGNLSGFCFVRRDEKAGGQRQSPAAPPWERGDAAGPVDDGFLRGIEGSRNRGIESICYNIESRRLRAKMLQAAAPIMPSSPADGSGTVVAATHALPVWDGFLGVGLETPFT